MSAPSLPTDDFEARCRENFGRQQIMRTFGAELTVIRPGYCEIEMPFNPALTQQTGFMHAGVTATIADNAGGYAAYSLMPPDSEVLAVEFKINYLAPGIGDRLRAVARCLKCGRTLGINEIEVYGLVDGEARLIAKMQQTTIRVDRKPGQAGAEDSIGG
ncbi:MAG: PaaI family thioesterase [Rhodospirillaceae bacterium]|nr:PaaI family thioesterase [Rhodospirillaceae bacterium]